MSAPHRRLDPRKRATVHASAHRIVTANLELQEMIKRSYAQAKKSPGFVDPGFEAWRVRLLACRTQSDVPKQIMRFYSASAVQGS